MEYKLNVSCSTDKLKQIRDFVKSSLEKHALPEIQVSNMVLAIDEICANLIIHSHQCRMEESFELLVQVDEHQGVTFKIIDKHALFDINQYEAPSLDDIVKKQRKGGLGLILVKRIMDEIELTTSPEINVCRLFKKINTPS
jgi:serine/threonine-protein kinase RsbW